MDITTTKNVTGRSIGSVTCRNSCQPVAPSIRAASRTATGISWRPARYRIMLYPAVHQIVARMMESIAVSGAATHGRGATPSCPR